MRGPSDSQNYVFFGRIHVRTGTIMLATLKIVSLVATMLMLCVMISRPQLFYNERVASIMKCMCNNHHQPTHRTGGLSADSTSQKHILGGNSLKQISHSEKVHHALSKAGHSPKVIFRRRFFSLVVVNGKIVLSRVIEQNGNSVKQIDTALKPLKPHSPNNKNSNAVTANEKLLVKAAHNDSQHSSLAHRRHYLFWRFVLTAFCLTFAVMLLHGATARSPNLLLPYFCIQIFGFLLLLFTLIKVLIDSDYSVKFMRDIQCIPWINRIKPFHYLTFVTLFLITVLFCLISIQSYLMRMVLACYKYLMNDRMHGYATTTAGIRFCRRDAVSPPQKQQEDNTKHLESLIKKEELPQYDDTVKVVAANQFMPPPYFNK